MRSFCKGAPHRWGFEIGKGNILGAGAKQCHSMYLRSHRAVSPSLEVCLVKISAVKEVPLGEILPWGCSISHALENLIQALDEEDQLWAAKMQLFCCIINILPYLPCPVVHPRVLQDSALVLLTPSIDFVTPVPVESVPGICSQDRSGSGQGHLMPLCKRWCFQVLPYK